MHLIFRLWNDERGGLLSAEYLLLGTLLTIGVIVGLDAVRKAIVTELADLAAAICAIDTGATNDWITFPDADDEEGADFDVLVLPEPEVAEEAFGGES